MSGKRTRADNVDCLETAARYAFPKRNGRSVLARILIFEDPEEEYRRKRQDIIARW